MKYKGLIAITLILASCSYTRVTEQVYEVASQNVYCQMTLIGWVTVQEPSAPICVQMRLPNTATYYPYQVNGFTLETGNTYKVRVRESQLVNGMMDNRVNYELITILEKTPVAPAP
jgi:hypothetical protein